jgi:hypothetical protein
MKAKTVTRHIVVLSDYEARLIYHVLRFIEKRYNFEQLDLIGATQEQLIELKESFENIITPKKHLR